MKTISIGNIISAGMAGLAGGAVIATTIFGHNLMVAVIGSLIGAIITGSARYLREKR